jgi:hypothetical protein
MKADEYLLLLMPLGGICGVYMGYKFWKKDSPQEPYIIDDYVWLLLCSLVGFFIGLFAGPMVAFYGVLYVVLRILRREKG